MCIGINFYHRWKVVGRPRPYAVGKDLTDQVHVYFFNPLRRLAWSYKQTSQKPVSQQPILPFELCELIIDSCDTATLKACTTVCRAFFPRARVQLCSQTALTLRTHSDMRPFIKVINSPWCTLSSIGHLKIINEPLARTSEVVVNELALRGIVIDVLSLEMSWAPRHSRAPIHVKHLYLKLTEQGSESSWYIARFLSTFEGLDFLSLQYQYQTHANWKTPPSQHGIRRPFPSSLTSLTISCWESSSPLVYWLLSQTTDKLKSLNLFIRRTVDEVPFYERFLKEHSPSLTHIGVQVGKHVDWNSEWDPHLIVSCPQQSMYSVHTRRLPDSASVWRDLSIYFYRPTELSSPALPNLISIYFRCGSYKEWYDEVFTKSRVIWCKESPSHIG